MSLNTKRNPSTNLLIGDSANPDTGFGITSAGRAAVYQDGTKAAEWDAGCKVIKTKELAITGASGSSGVFATMANPEGADLVILRAVLRITTQSTGASTLDIGVGANASTSNDGLFDGLSGAAAGLFDNAVAANAGTNGKPSQVWASAGALNVAEASGDVNGLVAKLYVTYMVV